MSSGFEALMALSRSLTKQSQSDVEVALAQRQRKEVARRKQQEEQERKERELERKIRLKHFEDMKNAEEQQRRLAEEERAQELARQRRAEDQRDTLRYGPKKARAVASASGDRDTKWPSSASQAQTRGDGRHRRQHSDDDADSSGGSSGLALTREEKRKLKLEAELKRTFRTTKRSTHTNGYAKAGKILPGGAIDVTTTTTPVIGDAISGSQSVKARIAAVPMTLTKLNVVKRDTRTIDEIVHDLAKARETKVLDGDDAREFHDWFGKGKKQELMKKTSTASLASGTNTPLKRASSPKANSVVSSSRASSQSPKPSQPAAKIRTQFTAGLQVSSRSSSAHPVHPAMSNLKTSSLKHKTSSTSVSSSLNSRPSIQKRPRSPSLSDTPSPPPTKKRHASQDDSRNSISAEIWKLFGKDRSAYVNQDVLSDDEDMEADARLLEKEEMRSSRIARQEEEAAMEAERRHEEEKRRKKKEREMREKRG